MTTNMTAYHQTQPTLLRNTLRANGLFSGFSGITFFLLANTLSTWTGIAPQVLISGIGVGLILFSGTLFWLAAQRPINRTLAAGVVAGDVVWVARSGILLAMGANSPLTTGGSWLVAGIAVIVASFAVIQAYVLWSQRRQFES